MPKHNGAQGPNGAQRAQWGRARAGKAGEASGSFTQKIIFKFFLKVGNVTKTQILGKKG